MLHRDDYKMDPIVSLCYRIYMVKQCSMFEWVFSANMTFYKVFELYLDLQVGWLSASWTPWTPWTLWTPQQKKILCYFHANIIFLYRCCVMLIGKFDLVDEIFFVRTPSRRAPAPTHPTHNTKNSYATHANSQKTQNKL